MSLWADLEDRSSGDVIRKEDRMIVTSDSDNLKEEENAVKGLLNDELHRELCRCLSIDPNDKNAGIGNYVVLSNGQKSYYDFFSARGKKDDIDSDVSKEIQAIYVLGEYYLAEYYLGQQNVFNDHNIILYIDCIKKTAIEENAPGINGKPPFFTVIRYVYLHELMHAFFHTKKGYKYSREQEEGLAEFGALFLLSELVGKKMASQEELDWAVRHVESKKGALECYARGAYLFKLFGHDKDLSRRMLEAYPKLIE